MAFVTNIRYGSSWDLKVGKRVVLRLWMKLAWWNPSKSEVTNWGESRSIQEYSTDLPILHYGCHPSKLESLITPSDLKCFSWNCNFWEILIHFVLVFQHSVNKFNHKSLCSVNLHSWWGPGLGRLSCCEAEFFFQAWWIHLKPLQNAIIKKFQLFNIFQSDSPDWYLKKQHFSCCNLGCFLFPSIRHKLSEQLNVTSFL